jgi:DNA-binding NarL/FixJ family response regulator
LVAILSKHTFFRDSAAELLKLHGFRSIEEYAASGTLLAASTVRRPDVILIDLDHESEDTLMLLHTLREGLPGARLVGVGCTERHAPLRPDAERSVETPHADVPALAAAIAALRYRRSPSAELSQQRQVWAQVTPRQLDVLRWLSVGADNESIARALGVGIRAIKQHVSALLQLFALENRTQLSLLADHAGLRPAPQRSRRHGLILTRNRKREPTRHDRCELSERSRAAVRARDTPGA